MPGLKQRVSGFAANGGAATLAVRKVADALKVHCVPSLMSLSLDAERTRHAWLLLSMELAQHLCTAQHAGYHNATDCTIAQLASHPDLACS